MLKQDPSVHLCQDSAHGEEADAQVRPWQQEIKQGDCFLYRSARTSLLTWGEVLEVPEDEGLGNYRLCRVFSSRIPDGEEGHVHIAAIHGEIPRHVLDKARDEGWPENDDALLAFARKVRRMTTN